MLTQKVKAVLYPCDLRLLPGEVQTPFGEEFSDCRNDIFLKNRFGVSCHYEVICIPDHIDLARFGGGVLYCRFQSV